MIADDGCEGDFSILCDSWPMIFALYFKAGFKLRYRQFSGQSLVCLIWLWSQERRQGRGRWMQTIISMGTCLGSSISSFWKASRTKTTTSIEKFLSQQRQMEDSRVEWSFPLFSSYYQDETEKKHGDRVNCIWVSRAVSPHLAWGGRALESDNFASQLVEESGMGAREIPLVAMTFYFHPFPKDTSLPRISLNLDLPQSTELYRLAGLGEWARGQSSLDSLMWM